MAVMFVISYNVTLLEKNNNLQVSEKVVRKKSWWEVYGEKKKDKLVDVKLEPDVDDLPEIEEVVSVDEETGKETELPLPRIEKGGFSRKK